MSLDLLTIRRGDKVSIDATVERVVSNGVYTRFRDDLASTFVPVEVVTAVTPNRFSVDDRVTPFGSASAGTVLLVGEEWAVVHLDHHPNPSVYDLDELERVSERVQEAVPR